MRAVFPNVGDSIFFCLPRLYFYFGDSLFVIQKAKLLHMNTVVNIAPRGLYFHGKVIGMLVVFLGYKILILVFFRVFWKVLCRKEIVVFLGLLFFHIE